MAFRAELEMGGKTYRLLHCNYSLRRDVDATGRPSSEVKGGTVNFEIESVEDTSIWDLMISQFKHVDGKVSFKRRDDNAKMKELRFETAYVIDYSESFDSMGGDPMTIRFTLSARELQLGHEIHENEWPV